MRQGCQVYVEGRLQTRSFRGRRRIHGLDHRDRGRIGPVFRPAAGRIASRAVSRVANRGAGRALAAATPDLPRNGRQANLPRKTERTYLSAGRGAGRGLTGLSVTPAACFLCGGLSAEHKRKDLPMKSIIIVLLSLGLLAGHAVSYQENADCPPEDPANPESDNFDDFYPPPPVPVTVESTHDGTCDDCGCFIQTAYRGAGLWGNKLPHCGAGCGAEFSPYFFLVYFARSNPSLLTFSALESP